MDVTTHSKMREVFNDDVMVYWWCHTLVPIVDALLSIFVRFTWRRWRSWLRHYATSRKVAGSIPDEVIGFLNWPNTSGRTVALGSTQPLTEMSTRNLPGGEGRPSRGADLTAISEPIV
jgi:hypothetical protein